MVIFPSRVRYAIIVLATGFSVHACMGLTGGGDGHGAVGGGTTAGTTSGAGSTSGANPNSPNGGGAGTAGTTGGPPGTVGTGGVNPPAVTYDFNGLLPAKGCWNYASNYTGASQDVTPTGTLKRTATLTGPVPTNKWWTPLIWNETGTNLYTMPIFAHPLTVQGGSGGVILSHLSEPWIGTFNATRHLDAFLSETDLGKGEITLGVQGLNAPGAVTEAFSDLSVTGQWTDGTHTLHATFTHGVPFVYMKQSGGGAQVTAAGYKVFYNQGNVMGITTGAPPVDTVFGDSGTTMVTSPAQPLHNYVLFAPTGATWKETGDGSTITSDLGGKDYWSAALLPDNANDLNGTAQEYAKHAFAFVTDTQVSWAYDANTSNLYTTYKLITTPAEASASAATPLIGLIPHQWKNTQATLTTYTYGSARGPMKVFDGNSFTTVMPFHGVLPTLPLSGSDPNTLKTLIAAETPNNPLMSQDSYFSGNGMHRSLQIALMAEQMGDTATRDSYLGAVKTQLQTWYNSNAPTNNQLLRYFPDWGVMLSYPDGGFYFNRMINDRHFHWGYFTLATTLINLYDPVWGADNQWGGFDKLLIRDADSPIRNDPMFPYMRTFDPYEGHGWAEGHGNFPDGANQESSSEALNFSQALILWGATHNDVAVRDYGIFLHVNEIASVQQYWWDVDQQVYPTTYQHPVVGMCWGGGGSYSTWWTAEPESIHGINFWPLTGGSLYIGLRPDALARNYAGMVAANGNMPEGSPATDPTQQVNKWVDVIWSMQAFYDSASAVTKLTQQLNTYPAYRAETKAHTYAFIHALDALGNVDTTTTANIPTYAVLTKNNVKTYIAFNGDCSAPANVVFSDGTKFTVAPHAQVTYSGGKTVATAQFGVTTCPSPTAAPPACP